MTSTILNARPLQLENINNKFSCRFINQIHFAPRRAHWNKQGIYRGDLIEKDFEQIFLINNNGEKVFVQLREVWEISFKALKSIYTLSVDGVDAYTFKYNFMTKYPATTNETQMAIYLYERITIE